MKTLSKLVAFFVTTLLVLTSCHTARQTYDVTVVGGGTSGTCAALQSARMGTNTLLVENYSWLGGMLTSAGVSAVDGNFRMPGGLWGEFLHALAAHYGSIGALQTGWVSYVEFEPSVGNAIFQQWAAKEKTLACKFNTTVEKVTRLKDGWELTLRVKGRKQVVRTSYIIDATELGDIAKAVGLPYAIGMDASSETHESQAAATAHPIIQDMTYVMTLKEYDTVQTIARPAGYDPMEFCNSCICKYNVDSLKNDELWSPDKMLTYGRLPNKKYMINWPPCGNDIYLNDIDCTPAQRDSLHRIAKAKTIRFLYFMQHELGMNHLGLADDEYPTADRLPFIPYYREGRRFKGVVQFNLNDILTQYNLQRPLFRTDIAVGDYPVDHHHGQYKDRKGLPDIHFPKIASFGVPLGIIVPRDEDRLLFAEKCVSVTNLVNGTTRLQPVSMQIGQAAGVLASLAVKEGMLPKEISVHEVQRTLLDAGGYLQPYLDVAPQDVCFKPLQRIGVMGILHGTGKNVAWQNETWFRADTLLLYKELDGLTTVYPRLKLPSICTQTVTLGTLKEIIATIAKQEGITFDNGLDNAVEKVYADFHLGTPSNQDAVTRKQTAVLVDRLLQPFERKDVNLYGEWKK
jgi:hypothetical protein